MVHDLTSTEVRVLLALKGDELTPRELALRSGLTVEAALQSAMVLEEKGLAVVKSLTHERYSLTEEGREYAIEGLPERQVLSLLPASIDDLKDRFSQRFLGISLGWLRKKEWAIIKDGVLVPKSGNIEMGEDEAILSLLLEDKPVDVGRYRETLSELVKRGILEIERRKTRIISLTDEGLKLVSGGLKVEEEIANLTPDLIRSGGWRDAKFRAYDIHVPPKPLYGGKIHPYQHIIREMREIFIGMGFTELRGEIVQSSFWNFDALFQPQDHPARDMQDTFYLKSKSELPSCYKKVRAMHENGGEIDSTGWGGRWSEDVARRNVLRTHTTAITIRYLSEHPRPPVKAFAIDRVYRREAIDPTHTPEFEQLEGVVMDEGVSFSDLLGYLTEFYHRMGFKDVRFRPGYFPYTEPSVEPEVYIEELGWVELGGAGIFRREVTEPLGIRTPVLAWGLGVSRVAMLRLKLRDLRELYQPDIKWLRRTPVLSGLSGLTLVQHRNHTR